MAGMSGVPYRLFLLYDGIGALLWAALWIGLGAYFAQNVATLIDRLENSRLIVLYLAGSLLLLFLLVKWIVRRRHGAATLAIPLTSRIQTPAALQDHEV